jgi:hypothetical protein
MAVYSTGKSSVNPKILGNINGKMIVPHGQHTRVIKNMTDRDFITLFDTELWSKKDQSYKSIYSQTSH